ncbi:MAG: hypothetical protein WAK63_14815, partial [Xanthobacteraceae bacterium]
AADGVPRAEEWANSAEGARRANPRRCLVSIHRSTRGGQSSYALRSLRRRKKIARPDITPIGPLINFNLPYYVAALSAGQAMIHQP